MSLDKISGSMIEVATTTTPGVMKPGSGMNTDTAGTVNIGILGLRNCVTGAPSNTYITGSGSALTAGYTGPLNLTFANGFNADGSPNDYTVQLATDASFWTGLTASATNYLFAKNVAGMITGTSAVVAPEWGAGAPAPFVVGSVTTLGTAESGGDNASYPASNAYDGNSATLWSSSQVDSARDGVSHIGRNFGQSVIVSEVTIAQGNPSNFSSYNCSNSIQFRYSNDGANWVDIGSPVAISDTVYTAQSFSVPGYPGGAYFDILRVSGQDRTNNDTWAITEITLQAVGLAGARYYDAIGGIMYLSDGTNWAQVQEVPIGQVPTNATNVTAEVSYPVARQQSFQSVAGNTANDLSTTATTAGSYILADPRATVTVGPGQSVDLTFNAVLASSSPNDVFIQFARSGDGGATWTQIGGVSQTSNATADTWRGISGSYIDAPGPGQWLYGISMWVTSGTGTAGGGGSMGATRMLGAKVLNQ